MGFLVVLKLLSNLRNQCIIGAIVFSFVSLYAGLLGGVEYFYIIAVIITFIFVYFGFPHVWRYSFWLAVIYASAFFGVVAFLLLGKNNILYKLAGISLELFSLYTLIVLYQRTKSVRDEVMDIKYAPLGLWSVALYTFFLLSNASGYSWMLWGTERAGITRYGIFEILLVLLLIYILWVPERRIPWGAQKSIEEKYRKPPEYVALSDERCPACGSELEIHLRACPTCGREQAFKWCPVSEVYTVRCLKCRRPTTYGKEVCEWCGAKLPKPVRCRHCGKDADIPVWVA